MKVYIVEDSEGAADVAFLTKEAAEYWVCFIPNSPWTKTDIRELEVMDSGKDGISTLIKNLALNKLTPKEKEVLGLVPSACI
jgi:hypothetical protein